MEHWKINRAGFVNFWYYDEEIFQFENGRLLLRGNNGSGKTVTMQSLIPLLLDGDRRPERLDPFGSKSRKMENYLLDENTDETERSGYIYMEFIKENAQVYMTIGLGLRAVKNQKLDSWGFCIADGRRIGIDFSLTKNLEFKIPLTKRELKNSIGEGGNVFESAKEYAVAVNNLLFGYNSIEEYNELINLLIQLRTPKLSKDFKPTVIYEILTNSLATLSDDDLRPMSEAIENMDILKSSLENFEASQKAADKIQRVYIKYNELLLLEKSNEYILAVYNRDCIENNLKAIETVLKDKNKNLVEKKNEYTDLEIEYKVVKEKYRQLQKNDLFRVKEDISNLTKTQAEKNNAKIQKEKILDIEKSKERNLNIKINNIESDIELGNQKIKDFLIEMEVLAEDLNLDEHNFLKDELLKGIQKKYSFEYSKNATKEYYNNLLESLTITNKQNLALDNYDNKCKELDKTKNKRNAKEKEVSASEQLLSEIKAELIEKIHVYTNKNKYIKLKSDELSEISSLIYNFSPNDSYDNILKIFRKSYDVFKNDIELECLQKKQEISIKTKEISAKEKELKDWKNKKDPEPQRTEEVIENRVVLKQNGIDFVPLYKAIDFKTIDDTTKGIIEKCLLDMGVLDALIIDNKYKDKLLSLDTGLNDRYIFSNSQVVNSNFSKYLIHENINNINLENIDSIIQNIFSNFDDCGTYIDINGTYGIGILKGTVDKNYKSRFIGINSRAKYRQEVIEKLEAEKNLLVSEYVILENKFKDLESIKAVIINEGNKFPDGEDLFVALKNYMTYNNEYDILTKELEHKNEDTQTLYKILKEIQDSYYYILQKIPLKNRSSQELNYSIDIIDEYRQKLNTLEIMHSNLLNNYSRIEDDKYRKADIEDVISELISDITDLENSISEITQKINAFEEQLALSGYDEIQKEIEECVKRESEIPELSKSCIQDISKLENNIENLNSETLKLKEKLKLDIELVQNTKSNFELEFNLKYVDEYAEKLNEDSLNTAKEIVKNLKTVYNLEKKSSEEYKDDLYRVFSEQKFSLIPYNLEIKATENRRIEIFSKYQGRELKFYQLCKLIAENIEEQRNLIKEKDRKIFEDILTNTMSKKVRAKIYHSRQLVEKMNELMESLDTSSGLTFSLKWVSKKAESEDELGTNELIDFLQKDSKLLTSDEMDSFINHFRHKINKAKKELENGTESRTFHSIIKDILDYRQWFEFRLLYKKTNENVKELTNNAFFRFSGGERAMAMYVPLFSAVYSRYAMANIDCPRIISLDEAFAGVDSKNIKDMFRLLIQLDLDFIVNSQVLWGDYDTVPSLAICELLRPNNANCVSVIRYKWNGKVRQIEK